MQSCCHKPNSVTISKSKIYILLVIVVLVYLATFFIQIRLITTRNHSDSSEFKISIDENRRIRSQLGLSGDKLSNLIRVDFESCAKLVDANIELNDLLKVKDSYLSELKKIEHKRRQLLKTINKLNNQLNASRSEIDRLEKKSGFITTKLHTDTIKLNDLQHRVAEKFARIKNIETVSDNFPLTKVSKSSPVAGIQSAIDISKCRYNRKMSLFLFEPSRPNEYLDGLVSQLDNHEIEKSVKFEKTSQNSCFILVILVKPSKSYYKELARFITENRKSNYLFVSPNLVEGEPFSGRIDFENYLVTLNPEDEKSIRRVISRSLFASFGFEHDSTSDLFIRFSVIYNPDYNTRKKAADKPFNLPRDYLLTYHHKSSSADNNPVREQLQSLKQVFNSSESLIIDLDCKSMILPDSSSLCYDQKTRLEHLTSSRFTLITDSTDLTIRLSEAISCSTIPVLIGLDLKLPLSDLIAWDEILIRLPVERVNYLVPILESIDSDDLVRRQIKSRKVFAAYFASPTHQLRTVVAAVGSRIGLPPVGLKSYPIKRFSFKLEANSKRSSKIRDEIEEERYDGEDEEGEAEFVGDTNQAPLDSPTFNKNFTQSSYVMWNQIFYPFNLFPSVPFEENSISSRPYTKQSINKNYYLNEFLRENNFTHGGSDGKYFHHHLGGNYAEEQYTIVILTYKRENLLADSLSKYLKFPYLHSIVVVWNDINQTPSKDFFRRFLPYIDSNRLVVVKSDSNSLNNRFIPYDTIKTDAVLSIDDDTSLRADEVMFAFRVWRENRARLVGFPSRYHSLNMLSMDYEYQSKMSCEYSMVLTGASFYHRFYHHVYSQIMDSRIRKKVDELKNCEDIAFNMLVAHMTRQAPLKVTTRFSFYCADCDKSATNSSEGAISAKKDHYEKRSECVRYFVSLYGYNPLLYSQYRADSVLYKTKLGPSVQKCFKLV